MRLENHCTSAIPQAMRALMLALWLLVLCPVNSKKAFFAKSSQVSKLDSAHFPSKTSKHNWLCLFYEPRGESSKQAKAEWIRLAGLLAGTGVRVGAVDCTVNQPLCVAQGSTSHPSVKLFAPGGTSRTYQGKLEAVELMDFTRLTAGRGALLSDPSRAKKKEKKAKAKKGKKERFGGSKPSATLTKYMPVEVNVGVGNEGEKANMQVYIPNKGETQISDPKTLMAHVKGAWDTVVEENQAGLVDTTHQGGAIAGLSPQEAWHHYKAGKDGVIDSARFLIAFSVGECSVMRLE
jgi:hypothetical protein